jgi:hypothetical protein
MGALTQCERNPRMALIGKYRRGSRRNPCIKPDKSLIKICGGYEEEYGKDVTSAIEIDAFCERTL